MQMYGMGVDGEALQLYTFIRTSNARIRIWYCKSHENLYQVLPVRCAASQRRIKSKFRMIKSFLP